MSLDDYMGKIKDKFPKGTVIFFNANSNIVIDDLKFRIEAEDYIVTEIYFIDRILEEKFVISFYESIFTINEFVDSNWAEYIENISHKVNDNILQMF